MNNNKKRRRRRRRRSGERRGIKKKHTEAREREKHIATSHTHETSSN
jgi:hypothetical protein